MRFTDQPSRFSIPRRYASRVTVSGLRRNAVTHPRLSIAALAASVLLALSTSAALAGGLTLKPYTFQAGDGTKVETEWGEFEVPEDRTNPNSRRLKLAFVRFKSTAAAP